MSLFNNGRGIGWNCQKILPVVYDDSLSYYEVLCKLTQRINTTPVIVNVPETSTDEGTPGMFSFDSNYLYICYATNSWKRCAISAW